MSLVKRILVGLDLGPDTDVVLGVASVVARILESQVSLLLVISPVLPEFGDESALIEQAKKESLLRSDTITRSFSHPNDRMIFCRNLLCCSHIRRVQ
jgi:hypothetical protein